MSEKKIPWWQPEITGEELPYIERAVADNFVNDGPLTKEFERAIAERIGVKHAMAVTSGTMALFVSLKAVGVGPGDEVIVPDLTFIATANAVRLTGATPILVDIDPVPLPLSPSAVEQALTPKVKTIIPVHVTGRATDMEALLVIARSRKIAVVEDAAEALTSQYKGRDLGTWGDFGCFSFAANKTISTGQGGMVVTDDDELFKKIWPLKDQGRLQRGSGGDDLHPLVGYNFKYTDLQAGFGLGQLHHLEQRILRMRQIYDIYHEELSQEPWISVFPLQAGGTPQWTDVHLDRRDELAAYLQSRGMDCRKYWYPLHSQQCFGLMDEAFPESTRMSARSLWLPSAFTLTDEDIRTICEEIKNFLS